MTGDLTGPPTNRERVLSALGRASTPAVPTDDGGPTLTGLTGMLDGIEPDSVLLIGPDPIADLIAQFRPVVRAVPGMTAELAAQSAIGCLVVDARAWRSGPWLGTGTHQSKHLGEEIFEAGRLLRARSGPALLVPDPAAEAGTMVERLRSTFTADLAAVPEIDREEGARQSPMWRALVELSLERSAPSTAVRP